MAQHSPDQHQRTLGLGISLLRPLHLIGFMMLLFGLPVILMVLLLYLLLPESGMSTSEMLNTFRQMVEKDPELEVMLWTLVVLLPLAAVVLPAHRLACLRITISGLQGYVPKWFAHSFFGQTDGRWNISWDNIRAVRLVDRAMLQGWAGRILPHVRRLNTTRLVLETDEDEVWIHPFIWFDRSGHDHRLGLGEVFQAGRFEPLEVMARAPLMHALEARGFEIESTTADEVQETRHSHFDLTQHKGMLAQVVLLFTVGIYAVLDTFVFGHWRPLGALPVPPFVATAAVSFLAVRPLGGGAPRLERLCVGALTVAALVAAVYPATLRINAMTAEPEIVIYVATDIGRFKASDNNLPVIDLSDQDIDEYLAQYPPGSGHEFTILMGIGGFYQLDLTPFYEQTREFYSSKRKTGEEKS